VPRSHPRPVAGAASRATGVAVARGARRSPVGWGSLRPPPNGRQRHCRPSRGVVGAGVSCVFASCPPPLHPPGRLRAAPGARVQARVGGVHRDVHRVCSVRIGCVPKSEMGLRVFVI